MILVLASRTPTGLVCPHCAYPAQPTPPGYWQVRDGLPAPSVSHLDGSALCKDPATGRPATEATDTALAHRGGDTGAVPAPREGDPR